MNVAMVSVKGLEPLFRAPKARALLIELHAVASPIYNIRNVRQIAARSLPEIIQARAYAEIAFPMQTAGNVLARFVLAN